MVVSCASLLRSRLILLLVLLALAIPQASLAQNTAQGQAPGRPLFAPGEVLIGWEPGQGPVPQIRRAPGQFELGPVEPDWQRTAAALTEATGLDVLEAAPDQGVARLKAPVGAEAREIERLMALPWVSYAEPNYYAYAAGASYPNDPDFGRQWYLHHTQAAEAWSMVQGSESFIVAVVDTGIASSHPEFVGQLAPTRLWRNFITGQDGTAEDDSTESHGTHVAGIVSARMNNAQGVAGLAPKVKILPLKVLDDEGQGPFYAVSSGIRGAVDRGAQVINLSLAGPDAQTLQDAIEYAQQRGALVVAAAGNCAQNPTDCQGQINPPVYPAAYPGVLAVAASDRFDRTTPYSGYQPYVGLAAPGGTAEEPIWSTANPASDATHAAYRSLYGTSMSTPLVAAAAALVWTLRPAATAAEIADILKSTTDKVGTDVYSGELLPYTSGRNDYFGTGRLNVANAVRWVYPPSVTAATQEVNLLLGGAVKSAAPLIEITNPSGQGVYWTASVLSPAPWLTLTASSGASVYGAPTSLAFRANSLSLPPGAYVTFIRVQPMYPTGLAPVDIRVHLTVSAALWQSFAPVVGPQIVTAWFDPDAATNLYRSVLPLQNDGLLSFGLPFAVQFYGTIYQSISISDNGLVLFGAGGVGTLRTPTACPGDGRLPNNAVYVLANDWNPSLGGRVVVHQPSPSTFVVSWQDVRRSGSALAQSFQLVITSDGQIRGNYRTVEAPLPGIIGTENYDAAFAQQVLCYGSGRQVSSGQSVDLETRLPW